MMRKTVFGLIAAVMIAAAGCGGGGGVPAEKLADTLGKLKANTADTPHTVKLDDTVNITVKMDDIYKTVESEGKYVILDFSACTAKDNTIDGKFGFWNNEYIKGFILPKTLTTIGWDTFGGWVHLTTISIPSGVTSIGPGAFFGCELTSVTIPSSVTEIGSHAFGNTLESVTFAAGSNIPGDKFGDGPPYNMNIGGFPGSSALRDAYLANGAGTYTFNRDNGVWTKK
jgi:hypothetical protein